MYTVLKKFRLKGAQGARQRSQVETRFVLGKKFRNRKRYLQYRKALEIWRIMVFELRKSVRRIKSYDQKTKKNAYFFKNPNFSTK